MGEMILLHNIYIICDYIHTHIHIVHVIVHQFHAGKQPCNDG